jgi:hypothetical protein
MMLFPGGNGEKPHAPFEGMVIQKIVINPCDDIPPGDPSMPQVYVNVR